MGRRRLAPRPAQRAVPPIRLHPPLERPGGPRDRVGAEGAGVVDARQPAEGKAARPCQHAAAVTPSAISRRMDAATPQDDVRGADAGGGQTLRGRSRATPLDRRGRPTEGGRGQRRDGRKLSQSSGLRRRAIPPPAPSRRRHHPGRAFRRIHGVGNCRGRRQPNRRVLPSSARRGRPAHRARSARLAAEPCRRRDQAPGGLRRGRGACAFQACQKPEHAGLSPNVPLQPGRTGRG